MDLSHLNLSGANLENSDITGAKLDKVNLSKANLKNAEFRYIDIEKVSLSETIWVDGRICKKKSVSFCS